ncbi:hypothetical protein F5888DRAFT_1632029 [Russula emetica]|nr:hypothetical protein F5888DRAFT_1632029 [Russula emetica]
MAPKEFLMGQFCGLKRSRTTPVPRFDGEHWVFRYSSRPGTCNRTQPAIGQHESIPHARYAHQVVYDSRTRTAYLHGGNTGRLLESGTLGDHVHGDDALAEQRLDDFWSMSLTQPAREEIVRRGTSKSHVNGAFRETYKTLPALQALQFLQVEVADPTSEEGEVLREASCATHWALRAFVWGDISTLSGNRGSEPRNIFSPAEVIFAGALLSIVVEVTSILGIATEVKQGRMEKCAKKLIGRRVFELDKLIHEEASDRTIAFNSAMSGDMPLNTGSPMPSTRKCHRAYERRWNTCLTWTSTRVTRHRHLSPLRINLLRIRTLLEIRCYSPVLRSAVTYEHWWWMAPLVAAWHFQTAKFLRDNPTARDFYGANVYVRNNHGKTPLHLSSQSSDLKGPNIALSLFQYIRAEERPHYPVASSGTIQYGRIEVVRVLLEHGTNVDAEDDDRKIINQVMPGILSY